MTESVAFRLGIGRPDESVAAGYQRLRPMRTRASGTSTEMLRELGVALVKSASASGAAENTLPVSHVRFASIRMKEPYKYRFRLVPEPDRSGFDLPLVLSFALVYLYLNLFVPPLVPIHTGLDDDKLFLYSATRILRGQIIYRDFFEIYFPGTDLVYALLIRLFGARAWIPNACLLCLGITFLWTSIVLSRKLVAGWAAFLPGLLFLWISFHSLLDACPHWYGNLLVMAAIAVLADQRSRTRLLIAGGLTALAACFTQQHGVFAALGFAVFILWEGRRDGEGIRQILRREFHFLVPFATIVAACVSYLVLTAGFKSWFSSTIWFPFKYWGSGRWNSWANYVFIAIANDVLHHHFHFLRPLITGVLVPGIYIIAIAGYLHSATSPPSRSWRQIILISTVGLATFASVVNSAASSRLGAVSAPAFIILIWLLERNGGVKAIQFLYAVTILIMLKDVALAQKNWRGYLDSPAGRVALSSGDPGSLYEWVARNTHQEEFVFDAAGDVPYFWFGLVNPTKLWWLTACDFTRPEQAIDAVQDLERSRAPLILWSADLDRSACSPTSDHIQLIRDYLQSHYRRIRRFQEGAISQDITIWERNTS